MCEPLARTDVGDRRVEVSLRVLASGSRGNCTALRITLGESTRLVLIDAGLSPKRTAALLEECGLGLNRVEEILFTHLDSDHFNPGWINALPVGAKFRIHRRHRGRAHSMFLTTRRTELFEEPFETPCSRAEPLGVSIRVRPLLMSHDDHGSAAFRFELPGGRSLGFATDLGRATEALVDHLAGVDVLAIESNYCPRMQRASGRPAYLMRRIMDGSGHLSNEQSLEAVRRIGPRERVVLLHLSEECNEPSRAASGHAGAAYHLTVTSQETPTEWIDLTSGTAPPLPAVEVRAVVPQAQGALFATAIPRA